MGERDRSRRGPESRPRKGAPAVPPPPEALLLTTVAWPAGAALHRVHLDRYAGDEFNPGVAGNARFSPIRTPGGTPIPTLYGGSSFVCAAMETVFHDVPFAPGLKTLDKARLNRQVYSVLTPARDLVLADLRSVALRKLGVPRARLIDTEKDAYPLTRVWAEAIHARHPEVQGLCWTSRQDDAAQAVMVFGDRVRSEWLLAEGMPRSLVDDEDLYSEVLSLAARIGVEIVTRLA